MLLSRLLQQFILIALIYKVIAMEFDTQQQQLYHGQISTSLTTTTATTTTTKIKPTKPTTSAFCGFMCTIKLLENDEQQQHAVNNCNAINLLLATLNNSSSNSNSNRNLLPNKKQNNADKNEDAVENENEIENRNEDDLLSGNSTTVKMSPSALSTTFPILTTLTLSTTAAAATTRAARRTASSSAATAMSTIRTTTAAAKAMSIMPLPSTATAIPQNLKLKRRSLSRPKRYLAFPEGSSFSVAVCFTVGIIGNPRFNYMSFGLNWGVAYDLPNASWVLNHLHGFSRHPVPTTVLRRRTRRMLYKEVERVVDNMGYNGRDCILRALCESRQYFQRNKLGMIGEMLRVVFSLPKQRIYTRELHEGDDIKHYDHAYRKARSIDCAAQYDCSFSLLELALGRYSTAPPGYYEQHN